MLVMTSYILNKRSKNPTGNIKEMKISTNKKVKYPKNNFKTIKNPIYCIKKVKHLAYYIEKVKHPTDSTKEGNILQIT